MRWIFLFVCFFSGRDLNAQAVRIRELRCRPDAKFYNTKDSTIVYPIIVTADPAAGRLINKAIEAGILEDGADDHSKTTRDALRRAIGMGLTDMSYEVTYNKNGVLTHVIKLSSE